MEPATKPLPKRAVEDVFDREENCRLCARIEALAPDARAQWGRMNAAQMLVHCRLPIEVATGMRHLPRMFIGRLLGKWAKKKAFESGTFGKNGPTHPIFKIRDTPDFATERPALIALVRRFAEQGPSVLMKGPHPFFGPLTDQEWSRLMWMHLDHHLRQFGV